MDRLQQIRLERRAAEAEGEPSTFRLFAAAAGLVLVVAAVGVGILSFELLAPAEAGAALTLGAAGGWPFFGLGRRHARRD